MATAAPLRIPTTPVAVATAAPLRIPTTPVAGASLTSPLAGAGTPVPPSPMPLHDDPLSTILLFACPACKQPFQPDGGHLAVLRSCLHTVCSVCDAAATARGGACPVSPSCPVTLGASSRANPFLASVLAAVPSVARSRFWATTTPLPCRACTKKTRASTHQCLECGELPLCSAHAQLHHDEEETHTVVSLGASSSAVLLAADTCPIHRKTIEFFCVPCQAST